MYDSYVPSIELAGGTPVFVSLEAPDYALPFDKIAAAITPKTRAPDDQHAAQSDRHGLARSRHAQARRDRARHERADRLRRSLRTHGLRRRAARERLALSGTREAQLRGVELRQDLSRDRLEGRLRGRARRAHRRVPQGAPVQRVHGEHADADRPRALSWKTRRRTWTCRRSISRSATSSARASRTRASSSCPATAPTSSASTIPRSATCPKPNSAQWLTSEIGVAAIPVSAFYHESHESGVVRFCFAKKEETLQHALDRLAKL